MPVKEEGRSCGSWKQVSIVMFFWLVTGADDGTSELTLLCGGTVESSTTTSSETAQKLLWILFHRFLIVSSF